MIHWLTKLSVDARLLVVLIAIIFTTGGIIQLQKAQMDIYPEFSPVYVEIQTEALGLSAEEVEQILTVALEQDLLNGIAYLKEIWSESMPGLSRIICIFEPGTDPMKARQVVAERLTQAHALPNVSKPPIMLQPYSSTSRVLKIGLTPANSDISLIDLSVLARWTIQPYLVGVEGVANVSIWGQRKRQMQVQVNPDTIKSKDIKLIDVIRTTGEALWVSPLTYLESSTPGTGGFFDTPNQRLGVRHVLPVTEPEHLANVALHGHKNMVLGDAANVTENHQPLIGNAIINGNSGLMLVVEKFPWANTIDVTNNIEAALAELKPGLSGVAFDSEIFRPAEFVHASSSNLSKVLIFGFVLAFLMLGFLFYEWRTALVSILSVFLSLLVGASVLYFSGITFNMMIIAGMVLAIGVIVDDAIAGIENVKQRLFHHQAAKGQSAKKVIIDSFIEMRHSILFATFIILLSIVPLYFIGGTTQKFLAPFAFAYLTAIAASLAVALTFTPALSMMLFANKPFTQQDSPILARLRKQLTPGFSKSIQTPVFGYTLFGAVVLTGLILLPRVNHDLNPPGLKMNDLVIELKAEEGTSLANMNKMTTKVIDDVSNISGVQNAVALIGRAVMSDKVQNVNAGEIWIKVEDQSKYEGVVSALQDAMNNYQHLSPKIRNYYAQSVDNSLRLTDHLHAIRIYGENQEVITKKAEEIKTAISDIKGLTHPKVLYPEMEPIIEVVVDMDAARIHKIKPGDVRRTATTLLAGIEVGSLFEGQKVFDVMVWGTPEIRDNLEDIHNLWIDKPDGGYVRLGEVAEVNITPAPRIITREAVSRYMDIGFDYNGNDYNTLAANIENKLAGIDFPLEYHAELTGSFKETQAANRQFLSLAIAAMIGILLLFQAAFMNWKLAFLSFAGMLMAISGGLIALFITGNELSLGAVLGFIAILSLATHHVITLFRHFRKLEITEEIPFNINLITKGIHDRFAAIMMSSIIVITIFLPIALTGNTAGLELIHPMSIVVIGGLIMSLLLHFYVFPGMYLLLGKNSKAKIIEDKSMLELHPEQTTAAMGTT